MIEEKNYYGNLCTEMYEILHAEAPQDELNFYLSYAEKGKKILEPRRNLNLLTSNNYRFLCH